jgi:hypothetical protein
MTDPLAGVRAIVTGGASGMGAGIVIPADYQVVLRCAFPG